MGMTAKDKKANGNNQGQKWWERQRKQNSIRRRRKIINWCKKTSNKSQGKQLGPFSFSYWKSDICWIIWSEIDGYWPLHCFVVSGQSVAGGRHLLIELILHLCFFLRVAVLHDHDVAPVIVMVMIMVVVMMRIHQACRFCTATMVLMNTALLESRLNIVCKVSNVTKVIAPRRFLEHFLKVITLHHILLPRLLYLHCHRDDKEDEDDAACHTNDATVSVVQVV